MFKATVICFCAVMILPGMVSAQPGVIDVFQSSWSFTCGSPPHPLFVSHCPAGDFEPVANGCVIPGAAQIQIQLIDRNGIPIPGIPPTDIWFQPVSGLEILTIKAGTWCTDFPTDLTGRTITTLQLSAGGCVQLGLQCVVLDPIGIAVILQNPIVQPISFNSPDLNGDLIVNLTDLALFGASYGNPGAYTWCCDYNDDGVVDLSDLAFFGAHYLHF
jgi:hypothetical protein